MTTADWAILIAAIAGPGGLITAIIAWINSRTAKQLGVSAHQRITAMQDEQK